MGKNIVICMDGTWNDPTERTNVFGLFEALVAEPSEEKRDEVIGKYLHRESAGLEAFYTEGVGANGRGQGVLGGALGVGLHARVLHAFLLASRAYEKGDKFWIFGFSRGAWSARSLAGFISKTGLLTPAEASGLEGLQKAQELWFKTKLHGVLQRGDEFWQANDAQPIELVGVWDTVGALGIPFFNGIQIVDAAEKHLFDFADLALSHRVRHGRHAMSIDECRADFTPTPWEARADDSIKQVWFAGAHADVGGGYPERGLSDIALEWMLAEAGTLPGAPAFDSAQLHPGPQPNLQQDRHDESVKAIWQARPRGSRQIPADALLHSTVSDRFLARADYRPAALLSHPSTALFYVATPPAEKLCATGESVPLLHLNEGEETTCDISAMNCWNAARLAVKNGESYAINALGKWKDKDFETDASGYESPNLVLKGFEGMRRLSDKRWFCLTACVHSDPGLEARNPNAGNVVTGVAQSLLKQVSEIDSASQLVAVEQAGRGRIDVQQDGYLYFFANDVPWAYSNNSGSLAATVTRVS